MAAPPRLPYARSFLVQFTADTDPALKRAAGRIEHLQTGQQSRFASLAALRERLAELLGSDVHAAPRRPAAAPSPAGARGRRAKAPAKRASTRRRTPGKRK